MSDLEIVTYWQGYVVDNVHPYPLNEAPATAKYIPIAFVKPVYKPSSEKNKTKQDKKQQPLCNTWSFDNDVDPDPFVYSTEQIQQWVQDINNRNTGQKVLFSLMDTSYAHWYPDVNIEEFAQNVAQTVNEWNLGGVDIDAESGMPQDKYVETFVKLIKCLREEMAEDKIISYTCYTESEDDTQILSQCKDDIDFLSTMAYWNNADGQISLFDHYADCIGDASKVGIGCKAGNGGDSTTIDTVKECAIWCKQNGYKRMMLWSLVRDVEAITDLDNGAYLDTIIENMGIKKKEEINTDWIEINSDKDTQSKGSAYTLTTCSIL